MKWWYSCTVWTKVGARFQIFTHSKSDRHTLHQLHNKF